MSYDLHITKAEHWVESENHPITKDDIAKIVDLLDANKQIPFILQYGKITLCGADGSVIGLMLEIADRLNARVQGDDGEFYNDQSFPQSQRVNFHKGTITNNEEPEFKITDEQREFIEGLEIGSKIIHQKFGMGSILEITGEGVGTEFRVSFVDPINIKRILVYYSPIQPFMLK